MNIKKIFACLLISVIAVTLFGCVKTEEVPQETAVPETSARFSEEELNKMAENMPEIVFVMSHHYDDTNILGCYITNTGEMKMYDFRNIAPDEIYEIPDVYDRLEEAVCSEIDFKLYSKYENVFTEKDLVTIPENKLIEYYNELLQINGTVIKQDFGVVYDDPEFPTGHYNYYGIKYDEHGDRQCILLYGYGESYSFCYKDLNTDNLANNLNYKIYLEAYDKFCGFLSGRLV